MMEKTDKSFTVGEQWRYMLLSENMTAAPMTITADNNNHGKLNLTQNHRHSHAAVLSVIKSSSAKLDSHGDCDALVSVLSTPLEESDESYISAVTPNFNGYFPLAGANLTPDHDSEQYDTINRRSDSCGDSRISLLRSTYSASDEFELQNVPAKPPPIAVPTTTHEYGAYRQVDAGFEVLPSFLDIQSTGTQQHASGLEGNNKSKKQRKWTIASTRRKLWLTEKLCRRHW